METPYNPPEFRSIDGVSRQRLDEIEHFFKSYNEMEGRSFSPTGRHGPRRAKQLVTEGKEAAIQPREG